MPRDNLLNSACLAVFEFIRRESIKLLIIHIVETYRDILESITHVPTFANLIREYEQLTSLRQPTEADDTSFTMQDGTPNRNTVGNGRAFQGLKDTDPDEEAYSSTSDLEDEEEEALPTTAIPKPMSNGASPVRPITQGTEQFRNNKEVRQDENEGPRGRDQVSAHSNHPASGLSRWKNPPERLAEKRRREEDEDEDDEMGKMMPGGTKRRSSPSSLNSDRSSSAREGQVTHDHSLRRKGSLKSKDGGGGKRLSIGPISLALKSGRGSQNDGDEDG
ncbi:Platinum sensitivity protein [Elasticomyces elasticus]|nr:hypothetical protein LTR28_007706 [Elasticomyces elasticus]KAK4986489.1 Platinum sensitivity protein [Elasticomyces elasticus]